MNNNLDISSSAEPKILEKLRARLNGWERILGLLDRNREKLGTMLRCATLYGDGLDFDNLTHDQAVQVMLAFGGKWEKSVNISSKSIDYQQKTDGITLRLWSAQPPPSCRLVEKTIEVPESFQPAHTETVYELVCKD